jgi:hypothetical protein
MINLAIYELTLNVDLCSRLNDHLLSVTGTGIDHPTGWVTYEGENNAKECPEN